MSHDIVANGRGFSIAVEKGYTDSTTVALRILSEAGNVVASIKGNGNLNLQNMPTSASGLSSGDIWSDGGTLKIV